MTEPNPTLEVDFRVDDSLTEAEIYAYSNPENHVFVASDTKAIFLVNSLAQIKRLVPATLGTVNPTVNDDVDAGYGVMETWYNPNTSSYFICMDNSAGAAVWEYLSGGFINDVLIGDLDGVNGVFTIPSGPVQSGAVFWDGNLISKDNYTISGDTVTFSTVPKLGTIELSILGNLQVGESVVPVKAKNHITVSSSGGDFDNPKTALDSITDNSASNQYAIDVGPGDYIINGTMQGKEYVSMRAIGDVQTVSLIQAVPDVPLFEMAAFFTIDNFTLINANGVGVYAVSHAVSGFSAVTRCVFAENTNGIHVNHVDAVMTIDKVSFANTSITTEKCILIEQGNADLDGIRSLQGNQNTLVEVTGQNSILSLNNVKSFNPDLVTGLKAGVLSRSVVSNISIVGATDGVVADGGSNLKINSGSIFNCTNDGLRINDVGSGTNVTAQSINIEDSTNWDLNLLSATCVLSGDGKIPTDMINSVVGSKIYMSILDLKEDDQGLNILGELHVGSADSPAEASLGGGDSYTRGMQVWTEAINEGANVWTDISEAAKSASASTFTFDLGDNGGYIYIASTLTDQLGNLLKLPGIKTKIGTAGIGGVSAFEYWDTVAVDYVDVNGFEAEDNGKVPQAKDYFARTESAHIRLNPSLRSADWGATDPMAQDDSYYWIRIKITTTYSTLPLFQQFKLHTNTFEANDDGWTEYRGSSRPIGQLPFFIGQDKALAGNLGDQSLWINEDVGSGLKENTFDDTGDTIGRTFFMPQDLDTSAPIRMKIAGRPAGTGTTELTAKVYGVSEGAIIFTANPVLSPGIDTQVVSKSVVTGEAAFFDFSLDVSDYVSRRVGGQPDILSITIESTSLGGGAFSMIALEAEYTKWCEGGHI